MPFHALMRRPTLLLREMVSVPQLAQTMTKMLTINAQKRKSLHALVKPLNFMLMENAWLLAQNSMKNLTVPKNVLFSLQIALNKSANC